MNETESLLKEGKNSLTRATLAGRPEAKLHPQSWRLIPEPQFPSQSATGTMPPSQQKPPLEFVVESQGQRQAWFGGRGYRAGEKIVGSGYTVGRIGVTFVELIGPQGTVMESTTSINHVEPQASQPTEAP
jgi:hypothetical protein